MPLTTMKHKYRDIKEAQNFVKVRGNILTPIFWFMSKYEEGWYGGSTWNLFLRLLLAQHVHFSTRALILGHHRTGTQIYQPIFELFKTLNRPVHN